MREVKKAFYTEDGMRVPRGSYDPKVRPDIAKLQDIEEAKTRLEKEPISEILGNLRYTIDILNRTIDKLDKLNINTTLEDADSIDIMENV